MMHTPPQAVDDEVEAGEVLVALAAKSDHLLALVAEARGVEEASQVLLLLLLALLPPLRMDRLKVPG